MEAAKWNPVSIFRTAPSEKPYENGNGTEPMRKLSFSICW
jgi:hypothetical protein